MPINYYIYLALVLFLIGVSGVIVRRNPIIVLMGIELMLNAVNVLMVAFSKVHSANGTDAQLFVFFIIVVAAVEATVGLSLIVLLYRRTGTTDVQSLKQLRY